LTNLFGVALLVIVGGGGKGDQQGRLAGGSQFCHRGRAAAGHHQVGAGKASGHVVKKRPHLPAIGVAPVAT